MQQRRQQWSRHILSCQKKERDAGEYTRTGLQLNFTLEASFGRVSSSFALFSTLLPGQIQSY